MKREIKTLVCDFPDGDGEHPARWPVRVSLDGEEYEADACDSAARRLEREFAPFMRAARPARRVTAPQPKRTAGDRRRTYAIRTWALERGLSIGERGRIPASVKAKYEQAHR